MSPGRSVQGHIARKRFGQNFLHDPAVIDRIVRAVNPQPGDRIVEIGPGLGAITEPLLDAAGRLDVIELDRDLAARLQEHYADRPLTLHTADALKFDFRQLPEAGEKLRIVGNLPYNISTPLLFHLMTQLDCIRDIHCMLQKEIVDRLAAIPNTHDYGRLSVMIQYHCQVTPLFTVGPGAFKPSPKVDSSVVRLTPHSEPPVRVNDFALFSQLVTQAFNQRRKTIRNGLKQYLSAEEIEAVGIDPSARPETLDLGAFARLADAARMNR